MSRASEVCLEQDKPGIERQKPWLARKIQTTLDLYTQEDGDEARAAQGEYLMALGVATNTAR